ncbi:MAG: pyridoxine 5-phosphate oxidase, partial [Bacteroidetes bacterium]|nr:pyridoxine 5-phosphate oxidase [Bacteroidota bacterium]
MKEVKKHINQHHDYSGKDLDENSVSAAPVIQFEKWMQDAIAMNIPDPNAMMLATADSHGTPSARVVLLRDFSDKG